jgi:prepilin-type N-terminal cleavage/methylation domain-containing protein
MNNTRTNLAFAARTNRRAYTLVEVLVVVAILGVAGGIIVPSMLTSGTLSAQAAVRVVVADILFAQNEAVARQSNRTILFDSDQNRYSIQDNAGNTIFVPWMAGTRGTGNYIIDFNADRRFRGVRIDRVSLGTPSQMTFDALGGVSNGGSLDVVSGNVRYRITIAPFTGRVTVSAVSGG